MNTSRAPAASPTPTAQRRVIIYQTQVPAVRSESTPHSDPVQPQPFPVPTVPHKPLTCSLASCWTWLSRSASFYDPAPVPLASWLPSHLKACGLITKNVLTKHLTACGRAPTPTQLTTGTYKPGLSSHSSPSRPHCSAMAVPGTLVASVSQQR